FGGRGMRCASSTRRRPRKPVVCLARARRAERGMESQDLTALVAELLEDARGASSMRSGRTIHGGREHHLRQTVLALAAGGELADHESTGEATLQVLAGRGRLSTAAERRGGGPGG